MTDTAKQWLTGIAVAFAVVLFIGFCGWAGMAGCNGLKNFSRTQSRKNAENRVSITKINIRNEQAQARVVTADNGVVQAQAYQRYLEAVGIRRAQDEISRTLTPYYLQHEAIQALERVGASGNNNTVVYVPSGPNGVPLVQTTPSVSLPKK